MRAPETGAARPGGYRASRWFEIAGMPSQAHFTPATTPLLIVADALRRTADAFEGRALASARRRLLRKIGNVMRGPVMPRHAQASLALESLDARLVDLQGVAR